MSTPNRTRAGLALAGFALHLGEAARHLEAAALALSDAETAAEADVEADPERLTVRELDPVARTLCPLPVGSVPYVAPVLATHAERFSEWAADAAARVEDFTLSDETRAASLLSRLAGFAAYYGAPSALDAGGRALIEEAEAYLAENDR